MFAREIRRKRVNHNHLNQERHLVRREIYKQRRSAAPAELQSVIG